MWRQNKKWAADCLSRFSKTREIRKTAPSWPVDGWALCFTRFRQFPTFSTRFTVHTSTHVQMFHSDGSQIENRRRIIGKKGNKVARFVDTSHTFDERRRHFDGKLTFSDENGSLNVQATLKQVWITWHHYWLSVTSEKHMNFVDLSANFCQTALPRNCNSSFSLVSSNKLKHIYFNYLNV